MTKIKILVVHDHEVLRAGLLHLLSSFTDFSVVGQADEASSLLLKLDQTGPDILLLGLDLPPNEILSLLEKIRRKTPKVQTLVLSDAVNEAEQLLILKAGANGILKSNVSGKVLQKAIVRVSEGEYWIDRKTIGRLFGRFLGPPQNKTPQVKGLGKLSKRENEILTLLGCGSSNREIAEGLFISEKTVKTHLKNIFSKLKINNRIQASMIALEMGLKP